MKRIAIVGGETHIGEITALAGRQLEIVGAAVRDDQVEAAREQFGGVTTTDYRELLRATRPDIVAVANENDLKAEVILEALASGMDAIADKPLAITMQEQQAVEAALRNDPQRRLLNLLTLRGSPEWAGLREAVASGQVGTPAFCHVRMAVRLKREQRPPWFLDCRRSGGLFLDLLIHGIDQVEWCTGKRIVALTASTGNLRFRNDALLRDHASVFCELEDGATALVEGQRMLPDTKASDYRMLVAGTEGYADLAMGEGVRFTNTEAAEMPMTDLPEARSVVEDWLGGGELVPQEASLRANRLAILATQSAEAHERINVRA